MKRVISAISVLTVLAAGCDDLPGVTVPNPTACEKLLTQPVMTDMTNVSFAGTRVRSFAGANGHLGFTYFVGNQQYLRAWNPTTGEWSSTLLHNGLEMPLSQFFPVHSGLAWWNFARDTSGGTDTDIYYAGTVAGNPTKVQVLNTENFYLDSGAVFASDTQMRKVAYVTREAGTNELTLREFGAGNAFTARTVGTASPPGYSPVTIVTATPVALSMDQAGIPVISTFTSLNPGNATGTLYFPQLNNTNFWDAWNVLPQAGHEALQATYSAFAFTTNTTRITYLEYAVYLEANNSFRVGRVNLRNNSAIFQNVFLTNAQVVDGDMWSSLARKDDGVVGALAILNPANGQIWTSKRTVFIEANMVYPSIHRAGIDTETYSLAVDAFFDPCGNFRVFTFKGSPAVPTIITP